MKENNTQEVKNEENETQNTQKTQELLQKEFEYIQNHPNTSIGCTVGLFKNNDYFNWKISLVGAKDTPYGGGLFFLKISFPKDYPESAPKINFITPIYHLNVCPFEGTNSNETLGYIRENTINFNNPPSTPVEILTKLYAIFYVQNEDTPFLRDILTEYSNNENLFKIKAKYFTQIYANTTNLNNGINMTDKKWDFSTNKYFIQFKNLIDQTLGRNQINIYIDDENNNNEQINLNFIINGKEDMGEGEEKKGIIIKCNKLERTSEVIKRFLTKIKRENDNDMKFIFGLRELKTGMTIGQNGLKDNHYITVISDYKCS